MSATEVRTAMKAVMAKSAQDESRLGNWDYDEIRPLYVPAKYTSQRIIGDCSKGSQYIAKWGGGPDPFGSNFGPYGNSSTMTAHLVHIPFSELQVGDFVTFGPDGDMHAAVVFQVGTTTSTTLLWNFGERGEPKIVALSGEIAGHGAYWYCLKLMADDPKPPPTPQERLREQTGYWSWVQWKLGEGAWSDYKAADPNVRPSVPKRISLNWWRRYAKFLLRRKKGH